MALINVAIDLRDPQRSGIARAATSIARALLRFHSGELSVSLAGPVDQLREIGAAGWGATRVVDWSESRYTLLGLGWYKAAREIGDAIWYFPHWDVPLLAMASPFVATINDLAHLQLAEHSGLKRTVARQWIRHTVRNARGITAISTYTAHQMQQVAPSAHRKLQVVPLAVDGEFFTAAPDLPAPIARRIGGRRYALSVGIRKERKNLGAGVEMLKQVPDLTWVVLGEEFPEWRKVEVAAHDAGVLDRMIVLDRQDESTLRALYANAAFLFFPSRYEGFGLPVLEALALGTPVIASNATSIPEVLGDAGWLCDPDDTACFIKAAREVLDLGTRRDSVVERGKARARELSWERTAASLVQVLRASAPQTALRRTS